MPFQPNQRVRSTKTGKLGTIKQRHDEQRVMVRWDGHFMPALVGTGELVLDGFGTSILSAHVPAQATHIAGLDRSSPQR